MTYLLNVRIEAKDRIYKLSFLQSVVISSTVLRIEHFSHDALNLSSIETSFTYYFQISAIHESLPQTIQLESSLI